MVPEYIREQVQRPPFCYGQRSGNRYPDIGEFRYVIRSQENNITFRFQYLRDHIIGIIIIKRSDQLILKGVAQFNIMRELW